MTASVDFIFHGPLYLYKSTISDWLRASGRREQCFMGVLLHSD